MWQIFWSKSSLSSRGRLTRRATANKQTTSNTKLLATILIENLLAGQVRAQEGDSSEEKLLATKSNKLPATNIIENMQASSDMNC